jgi:type III secretion protein C
MTCTIPVLVAGRRARLAGLLIATALAAAAPARSAEVAWPPGPYNYIALDQDLRDALAELGRNTGVPVKLSDAVRGRLHNVMPAASAEEFLRRLCDSHGLVPYFDGFVLHIATVAEIKTDVIPLAGKIGVDEARERLRKLGIEDARYPLRSTTDGVVSVSGPPPYLALLRQTLGARTLRPVREEAAVEEPRVKVFRGGV